MTTTLSQLRAVYFPNDEPTSHRIPIPDGGSLHLAPLAPHCTALEKLLDDWTPLTLDAVRLWYCREHLAVLVATTDHLLLFCYCHRASFEAHVARISAEIAEREDPQCGCEGKGWAIFNAVPEAGDLGEVQRCDTCALFPTDEDAQDAARFTGLLVDLEGKVLPEPEGLFPYIERNQTMIALLRARIADVGRLLGTAEGARFYVLADRVYCHLSITQLQYCGQLADFERQVARGAVPAFRRA